MLLSWFCVVTVEAHATGRGRCVGKNDEFYLHYVLHHDDSVDEEVAISAAVLFREMWSRLLKW